MTADVPAARPKYNAFLSYSHAADGALAPALQSALQRLARPWNRLRALRIFRDQTSLSASPELWPAIVAALADADYFLLLASPAAAASRWVQRGIEWWLEHRSPQRMLVLVTGGDLSWDEAASDFDWSRTDAIPSCLRARFPSEPLWVDLRWVTSGDTLSLRHVQFRQAVLDVAAPLHGRSKDELDGEDVRQFARTRRLARGAVAALVLLTVGALAAAVFAVRQRNEAMRQTTIAQAGRLGVQADLLRERGDQVDESVMLAAEGARLLDEIGEHAAENDLSLRRALALQLRPVGHFVGYDGDAISIASDQRHIAVQPVGTEARVYTLAAEAVPHCDAKRIGALLEAQGRPHFVVVKATTASGGHCVTITMDASAPREVAIWSVAPLAELAVVSHTSNVNLQFALSEDAEFLAITDLIRAGGGEADAFRVWSRSRRADVLRRAGADFVAFGPDRRLFAASDGIWRLPEAAGAVATPVLRWPRQPWTIVFSRNGRFAATLDASQLAVWDLAAREPAKQLVRATDTTDFGLFAVSDDGRLLVLTDRAGVMVRDHESEATLARAAADPKAAIIDGDRVILAVLDTGADEVDILSLPLAGAASAMTRLGSADSVRWMGFGGARVALLVESNRGVRLEHWTPSSGKMVPAWSVESSDQPASAVSADNLHVAVARPGGLLLAPTDGSRAPIEVPLPHAPDLLALSAHAEVVAATAGGMLEVRALPGGAAWRVTLPSGIEALRLSDDGRYALAIRHRPEPSNRIGDSYQLLRWRLFEETAPVVVQLGKHQNRPDLACATLADGSAVRVGDKVVDIAAAAAAPRPLAGFEGPCAAPIASPSMTAAISESTLVVTDRQGQPYARLEHPAPIQRAALSVDGSQAATLDGRGVLRLWPLPLRPLIAQACGRAPRPLGRDAWVRYLPAGLTKDACGRPPADAAPPP